MNDKIEKGKIKTLAKQGTLWNQSWTVREPGIVAWDESGFGTMNPTS
jgi:hypothetical protein